MTNQELRALVAGLAPSLDQLRRFQAETAAQMRETDRHMRETDRRMQETDRLMQETSRELKELGRQTDRELKELGRQTDRQLKELGRQIGGLGEKFGGFTEGMALPSMTKLLRERFGMDVVAPSVRVRSGDEEMEVDVLAYSNSGAEEVYLVEVKSRLRDESLEQIWRRLRNFPRFFPMHRDKDLYGIVAAVDIPEHLRRKILAAGLYLAKIHDETFRLDVPEEFQARSFRAA